MGAGHGAQGVTGPVESSDSSSGESSFRFPVTGNDWTRFHSGGVGLSDNGSLSVRGFFGSKGVVRLGVMETI